MIFGLISFFLLFVQHCNLRANFDILSHACMLLQFLISENLSRIFTNCGNCRINHGFEIFFVNNTSTSSFANFFIIKNS